MKNWKIGVRITVGFAAVIVIAVFLGVFALSRISMIHARATDVTENSIPSIVVMSEVNSNTQAFSGLLLRHAVSSDKREMESIDKRIQELRTRNSELLHRYETELFSNDEDRRLFKNITDARAAYWAKGDEMLKVSRLGTVEANKKAVQMAMDLTPLHDKFLESTEAEVKFNQDLAAEASKSIESSVRTANYGVMTCILLAVIFSAVIAYYIARGISRPLGQLTETAKQIALGDVHQEVDYRSGDEVGMLADSFRELVGYIRGVSEALEKVAIGDLSAKVEAKSDRDVLTKSYQATVNAMNDVIAAAESIARGDLAVVVKERSAQDKLMQALNVLITAMNEITRLANEIAKAT